MKVWINKALSKAKSLYQFAEEVSSDPMGIPLSQQTVNGLLQSYVTSYVDQIIELKANIKDHDFDLTIDATFKGIFIKATSSFSVIQFVMNDQTQRMVFLQKTPTKLLELRADAFYKTPMIRMALWGVKNFSKTDAAGLALEYFKVAEVKDRMYYLDIGQYFDENSSIIRRLKRFQVTHAVIAGGKLHLQSKINLQDFFDKQPLLSNY